MIGFFDLGFCCIRLDSEDEIVISLIIRCHCMDNLKLELSASGRKSFGRTFLQSGLGQNILDASIE